MPVSPLVRGFEVVIGVETHAQLHTRSKAFSGAATAFGAAPNTQASAVDLALPGTLPVLNRAAVECAIRFGLAVGARIAPQSIFARKNYFYPDLPKGYQISQYETPVVQGGRVPSGAPGLRTDTLASQRNEPSCMLPSQMPSHTTSVCSARAYSTASAAERMSGSVTISNSGVPARFKSMPDRPWLSEPAPSCSDLPASRKNVTEPPCTTGISYWLIW